MKLCMHIEAMIPICDGLFLFFLRFATRMRDCQLDLSASVSAPASGN